MGLRQRRLWLGGLGEWDDAAAKHGLQHCESLVCAQDAVLSWAFLGLGLLLGLGHQSLRRAADEVAEGATDEVAAGSPLVF